MFVSRAHVMIAMMFRQGLAAQGGNSLTVNKTTTLIRYFNTLKKIEVFDIFL
jgi:hypothetical protein